MALFGKKKPKDTDSPDGGGSLDGGWQPQPDKAAKFFLHAKTVASTSNFSYALNLFARGLRFDPANMAMHETIYETGVHYLQAGGKSANGKELKEIDGPNPVDKMAVAEFAWVKDLNNLALAMKLLGAVAKAGQEEYGVWLAPRVLAMMRKAKKQNKSLYAQGKDLFSAVGAWNEAFAAAEEAIRLDPTDSQLMSELNELSAQRAIAEGGFNDDNKDEAGFRRHVKNLDDQLARDDEASLSGGSSAERALARAKRDYEENNDSPDAINKYAQLLRRGDTDECNQLAARVYIEGFKATGQYRFRMAAGDMKMSQQRKAIKTLEAEQSEGETSTELDTLRKEHVALRASEFAERVTKYPTDRGIRFELGLIEFEGNNFEDAMAAFQQCKDEAKYRTRATHMLGKCFAGENWHVEAVGEFREAIEKLESAEKERELPIRYDLMTSLIALARQNQAVEEAREAAEICSAILRKNIAYRDIRSRRKELDALIKELDS